MNKKIVQIIGTRPHLTKFINITGKDIIIWTGQHYDESLISSNIETPKYDLKCTELGDMVYGITNALRKEKPDVVVVYGDTRSSLAGAIAASDLNIKIAHIESGVRLFDDSRPEERNRKVIDSLSSWLFCSTESGLDNLRKENNSGRGYFVGDLMYDNYLENRVHSNYIVATIHREENTKDRDSLYNAIKCLDRKEKVYFYCHPRTRKAIQDFKIKLPKNVELLEPTSNKCLIKIIKDAKLVITDSGGLIREAFFSGTPVECVGETEWKEIFSFGCGNAKDKIKKIFMEEILC